MLPSSAGSLDAAHQIASPVELTGADRPDGDCGQHRVSDGSTAGPVVRAKDRFLAHLLEAVDDNQHRQARTCMAHCAGDNRAGQTRSTVASA